MRWDSLRTRQGHTAMPCYPLCCGRVTGCCSGKYRPSAVGGMSLFSEHLFLGLAAFLVGALLLTSYGARWQRVWTPKRVRPEIAL